MKKLLLALAMCMISFGTFALDQIRESLEWQVCVVDPTTVGNPIPKSPIEPPSATLDGYTLTFDASHPAYTLTLLDGEDEVAWQVTVPANVSIVYLPATLSGDYVLTLYPGGSYYFWSEITL